jgi:phage host-nuclease inhibitor protein Gam
MDVTWTFEACAKHLLMIKNACEVERERHSRLVAAVEDVLAKFGDEYEGRLASLREALEALDRP